jgi:hypothetical protein
MLPHPCSYRMISRAYYGSLKSFREPQERRREQRSVVTFTHSAIEKQPWNTTEPKTSNAHNNCWEIKN